MLQSGESCITFYIKEFCQKSSSNFQSGEFYSFPKAGVFLHLHQFLNFQSGESFLFRISGVFSCSLALACIFFINLFMRLQSGESFTSFYTREFCQKSSSNFQSGEFYSFPKAGVFCICISSSIFNQIQIFLFDVGMFLP